jgi:P2 phage tail completion protein R (GpR)
MNKATTFRRAIAGAVPELNADPDKLLVFVDAGHVIATAAPSLSFEYQYTLNAIITDFAGDADAVFVALIEWIQRNQSDLLANPDTRETGISFEVDHLTQTTCDLSIQLKLTETVIVATAADGTRKITHVDEHVPEWTTPGLVDPSWTN